jgi:hypothetical protein
LYAIKKSLFLFSRKPNRSIGITSKSGLTSLPKITADFEDEKGGEKE